jgi:crotonobetainyl-CoA:carnitine CoA-transferase CaiB-like acyl-CoA transferase
MAADLPGELTHLGYEERLELQFQIEGVIGKWTNSWDAFELAGVLQGEGIPAGPVERAPDLLQIDQQLSFREHWIHLDHAEMGRTVYSALPYRMQKTPARYERGAPLLGEHTHEVLSGLCNFTSEEIEKFRADGVLQ